MNILCIGGGTIIAVMVVSFIVLKLASKTQNEGFEQAEKEKDGMLS
jgi:hypothetical protein